MCYSNAFPHNPVVVAIPVGRCQLGWQGVPHRRDGLGAVLWLRRSLDRRLMMMFVGRWAGRRAEFGARQPRSGPLSPQSRATWSEAARPRTRPPIRIKKGEIFMPVQALLTSETSFVKESLASPKSIIVFGS